MSVLKHLNAAALLVAMATPAAMAAEIAPGVYGEFELSTGNVDFPDNKFFAQRGEGPPFARIRNLDADKGEVDTFGYAGALYVPIVSVSDVPDFIVWLNHSDTSGDRTSKDSFVDNGPGERFGFVVLDNSGGFGTPDGTTLTTRIRQEIDLSVTDVLADFTPDNANQDGLNMFVGFSVMNYKLETKILGQIVNGFVASTTLNQKELMDVDYRGVKIAGRYNRALPFELTLNAVATAAYYMGDGDWQGTQTLNGNVVSLKRSANNADTAAFSGDVSLTKQFDGFNLSLSGKASQINDVQTISYGSSAPTDPAGGVLQIVSDDLTSWSFGLRVGRPL